MGNVIYPLWAECPALARVICVGYPVLSILMMIVSSSSTIGLYLTQATFYCNVRNLCKFWLWTLVVGPFFKPVLDGFSFVMMLFEIYMVAAYLPHREKELGSTVCLFWMFLMNICVNVVYLAVQLVFFLIYHQSGYFENSVHGLWPLVMICLTLRLMADPNGSTSFWGVVMIPNKWFPLCLVGFFTLLGGLRINWELLAALAIGYGYPYLPVSRVLLSPQRAARLEQRCCGGGHCSILNASWIPAIRSNSYDSDSGRHYANLSGFGQMSGQRGQELVDSRTVQPSGSGVATNFEAFSGSGNRLGDGTDTGDAFVPLASGTQAQEMTSQHSALQSVQQSSVQPQSTQSQSPQVQ